MSAKAAIAALKVQLATVYTTRTGRAALETTTATLPVITIYSTGDARAADQDYSDLTFTRRLTVEVKVAATSSYDDTLDDALAAIRAVIQQDALTGVWWGGNALRVEETSAAFFAPAPNSNEAVLQITLEFDYRP
jgi:hypothetical protein